MPRGLKENGFHDDDEGPGYGGGGAGGAGGSGLTNGGAGGAMANGWGSSNHGGYQGAAKASTSGLAGGAGLSIAKPDMCYFCFDVLYCHLYHLDPPRVPSFSSDQ